MEERSSALPLAAPYGVTLANLAAGTHTLTARATDNQGWHLCGSKYQRRYAAHGHDYQPGQQHGLHLHRPTLP